MPHVISGSQPVYIRHSAPGVRNECIASYRGFSGNTFPRTGLAQVIPAWPLQRSGIIQKMRYLTVPLDIRSKLYDLYSDSVYWTDHYGESRQYGYLSTDDFRWNGSDDGGRYIRIEAQIPEYWAQGNTVCKIAFEGGWYDPDGSCPPPPVDGCGWHDGSRYSTGEYTGRFSARGVVRLFGAADLSTHPDFARYFDPNE